jgi:hypothetical protein
MKKQDGKRLPLLEEWKELVRVIASEARQSLFTIAGWLDNPDCFASLAMTQAGRAFF